MKTDKKVVPLRSVKTKTKNTIKNDLVQDAIEIRDNFQGDVQAYAIIAVNNGGNYSYVKYQSRKDFPLTLLPDLIKRSLEKNIELNYILANIE